MSGLQFQTPPPPQDRSKYAEQFAALREPEAWGQWVLLDRVRGGGLRYRLEMGHYVGLRGLSVKVESHRAGDKVDVYVMVTGREENGSG